MTEPLLLLRPLEWQAYEPCWLAMRAFTDARGPHTPDELWLVEHPPVFTQGQAGRAEHVLRSGDIPLVQSDRGGQVTYHGPGQLVAYPLIDIKRLRLGVRELVTALEQAVVALLDTYGVRAAARADAPGVYVEGRKIASLGLRVRRGCAYHGVAINVAADLSPFEQINPCGYAGLRMVNLAELLGSAPSLVEVGERFAPLLAAQLGLPLGKWSGAQVE